MVILSAGSPAQAETAILTPDGSGNIRYDGSGIPNTRVNLSVSATINASEFGDSIEFYEVDVQPTNYFTIEVSPVSAFSVSGKISWTPLWINMGGLLDGNTGSFAYSVAVTEPHYDIKIEAQPTSPSVSVIITSMYLTDDDGDYSAVFNVNNVPDGVYSIKQDGVEVAKAYVGLQTYTMSLKTGWNLVSVPLVPLNDSIVSLIPPEAMANIRIIWHYDNSNPSSPLWKFYKPGRAVNTLANISDGMGFWVLATSDFDFVITGMVPQESHITYNKGWNMVGPEGLSTNTPAEKFGAYYLTWGYKNQQWFYYKPSRTENTLTEIKPGQGYWVLVR
jgi:hypothetical protein